VGIDRDGAVCRLERWQSPWGVTRELTEVEAATLVLCE
jgi:hypothetical protein